MGNSGHKNNPMKIQFQFDKDQRSFTLTPEDDLEKIVMLKMLEQAEKGSQMKLSAIEGSTECFRVEMKVNGK